jgi:hypothetical protein
VHLPDIVELAKEVQHRAKASNCTIFVESNGTLSAHVFFSTIPGIDKVSHVFSGFRLDKPTARTPEDLLALVDQGIEQAQSRNATAADFGITEDGRPLTHAAE